MQRVPYFLMFMLASVILTGFHSVKSNSISVRSLMSIETAKQSLQAQALTVLENKCNACHLKKNKSVIFTAKNMENKARDIHYQVFVKKRMPKGKEKLTEMEYVMLGNWLKSIGVK